MGYIDYGELADEPKFKRMIDYCKTLDVGDTINFQNKLIHECPECEECEMIEDCDEHGFSEKCESMVEWKERENTHGFVIQAKSERFLICKKPYKDTYFYTIVDLLRIIRGPDDYVFGTSYDNKAECEDNLRSLEKGRLEEGGCEVSHRHAVILDVIVLGT